MHFPLFQSLLSQNWNVTEKIRQIRVQRQKFFQDKLISWLGTQMDRFLLGRAIRQSYILLLSMKHRFKKAVNMFLEALHVLRKKN